MAGKRILVMGIDPDKLDFSSPFFKDKPGLTAEVIQAGLDRDRARMRAEGLSPTIMTLDPEPWAAEQEVRYALGASRYDVIVIGAGVRADPDRLILFEQLINLVHELAPTSKIAFNTSPDTTADAAARWI